MTKPATPATIPAIPPVSLEANDTTTIAPLRAISNSDILPTVSIDVLKPKVVSSADIPTTSAPRAATTPTIIHI